MEELCRDFHPPSFHFKLPVVAVFSISDSLYFLFSELSRRTKHDTAI